MTRLPRVPLFLLLAALACTGSSGGNAPSAGDLPAGVSSSTAPHPDAGPDQTVGSGATVELDGSFSASPKGKALTHRWAQTAGPAVTLQGAETARPTFTAPSVPALVTLVFQLTVSDGQETATASTSVSVEAANAPPNAPPVASIVAPTSIAAGEVATLDAAASTDPGGDSLTYAWTQLSGPAVTLVGGQTASATFQAPGVAAPTPVAFGLTVTDHRGASDRATVEVSVLPASSNRPPVASAPAAQTVAAGAAVTLDGSASADPEGEALAYAWTQTGGPTVALAGAAGAKATFAAPHPGAATTLTFSLVVTDAKGLGSAPATVAVTVNPPPAVAANITKVVSLHNPTRTSVVVFFMTDVAVRASVDYGVGTTTEIATEAAPTTRHVVTLSGLRPDTTYQYRVRAGTATQAGSFSTATDHAVAPRPFRFVVVGDARGHAAWTQVAKAILAKQPRFMIQTGDYSVAGGTSEWLNYYAVAKELFANVPVYAVQGNHDVGSNFSLFNVAPQSSSGSDLYFAFVWGNAAFVGIDTNSSTSPSSAQWSWVNGAMQRLSGGPLFAFHHHPLYSCGSHGSSTTLQTNFKAMFERSRLTSDYTGHDHAMIVWAPQNGVRYVVAGGGGAPLYALSGCQGPFARSAYGFMTVDVDGATVTETIWDQNGNQLWTSGPFQAAGPSVDFTKLGGLVSY